MQGSDEEIDRLREDSQAAKRPAGQPDKRGSLGGQRTQKTSVTHRSDPVALSFHPSCCGVGENEDHGVDAYIRTTTTTTAAAVAPPPKTNVTTARRRPPHAKLFDSVRVFSEGIASVVAMSSDDLAGTKLPRFKFH